MPVTSILEIIRLLLEITNKVLDSMPVEARTAAWQRHEERMQFWQELLKKFQPSS